MDEHFGYRHINPSCLLAYILSTFDLIIQYSDISRYCRHKMWQNMVFVKTHNRMPMPETIHRHDITDKHWALLEPHLPGRAGVWGGVAQDNRQFINAVFWILRTGAPWRDLPASYGGWKNTHRRFCRWRDQGIWELLLEKLIVEPDYEWLMIDASHCKVRPHAAGARGGNQGMSRTKGGSTQRYIWPWMRMVCRSEQLLQRVPERIAQKLTN